MSAPEADRMASLATEWLVTQIITDIGELPDYTSPDDNPTLLTATENEIADILRHHLGQDREQFEALVAQRDDLLAALKPFADLAQKYDPPENDDGLAPWDLGDDELTLGHLRAARAAISRATLLAEREEG